MTFGIGYVVVALAVLMAAYAFVRWHSATDASRYAALLEERGRDDAKGAEIDLEMTLRMAAAEFRHKVSMAVVAEPGRAEAIIIETAKEEALLMAATDRAAAKSFLAWVENAGMDEILHPAALRMVWKASKDGGGAPVTRALRGALRVQ